MKLTILPLLFFLIPFALIAQESVGPLTVYSPTNYNSGYEINTLLLDHRGILFIGNENEVLEFDGTSFRKIKINGDRPIFILYQDLDKRIYVGGLGEFGYLDYGLDGKFQFTSLISKIKGEVPSFEGVWQIFRYKGKLYFQTYEALFEWDSEQVNIIQIPNSHFFPMDGELYGTSHEGTSFWRIEKDSTINSSIERSFTDMVYTAVSTGDNNWLLLNEFSGIQQFNTETLQLTPQDSDASRYISKYYLYDGIFFLHNYLALATYEGGAIISDKDGSILSTLTTKEGLPSDYVTSFHLGLNDDIWIGTTNGFANASLENMGIIKPPTKDKISQNTIIRRIYSSEDSVIYARPFDLENQETDKTIVSINQAVRNLVIEFANPSCAGKEITFQTYLEGYDEDWNPPSTQGMKEYTGLNDNREYVFRVKTLNGSGVAIDEASIPIHFDIPWYDTGMKYLLLIPLVLLGMVSMVKLRTYNLERNKSMLRRLVKERTRDLMTKQEELETINKQLVATNRELDSFLYHSSHDLKAPLKSVMGLINLAKKENLQNENIKEYLELIQKSVSKLDEFIASVIEYSINTKSSLDFEPIDFEMIVSSVLTELSDFEGIREIEITQNILLSDDYYSDPRRIKIILNNLVSNAIKYHDLNKVGPFIDITIVESNENTVVISVRDNGIGMKPDYQKKVFEMFFRGTDKSDGSGLGLYILNETVTKLGGLVKVDTTFGQGTTMNIILPKIPTPQESKQNQPELEIA